LSSALLDPSDKFLTGQNRFVPEKFEELFTKFAKTEPLRLSSEEVSALVQANRNAYDSFGS
jgi:peroxygenase